jgi:hypothetical protein
MHNFVPNVAPKLDVQPLMSISAAQAVSYQFQVVEYMKDDKIMKVELQVQATTHDAIGNILHSSGFTPVPRIALPFVEYSK